MTGAAYKSFQDHLFPGDGLEAVAFAFCGCHETDDEEIFTVHSIVLYPHDKCTIRAGDRVEWSPAEIVDVFETCKKKNLRLLKIHSHPEFWPFFSQVDDKSDIDLGDTLTGWTGRNDKICSVVMLPGGGMIGRLIDAKANFLSLNSIIVISDNILCFHDLAIKIDRQDDEVAEFDVQLRTKQAFGEGTTNILKQLKIGVVGCSGTGSIVAELLNRLGVGHIVLVDHDKVEFKNVNRILNSTTEHARKSVYKVKVLKDAFELTGTGVKVTAISSGLHSLEAYNEIASCDIMFGCMDTIDGRHLLNRIATYFCSAFFDIGIRLDADGVGGINEVLGRIDYIQPGLSSLLTRERYTVEQLKAADLARTDPEEHKKQVKEGYIKSANVDSPAVISINMVFSSQAVTELLARLHPFKDRGNEYYASISFSLSGFLLIPEKEGPIDQELKIKVGLGHRKPPLDSPMLILPSKL